MLSRTLIIAPRPAALAAPTPAAVATAELIKIPIPTALAALRAIPTEWGDDAYSELDEMRHGAKDKRNGGH